MCSYNFYVVAQENLSLFILILKNAAELFYCKKFFKPALPKNPIHNFPTMTNSLKIIKNIAMPL